MCLTKFKNNQILLNKISHRLLSTTKLFTGWKSLILHNVQFLRDFSTVVEYLTHDPKLEGLSPASGAGTALTIIVCHRISGALFWSL